MPHDIYSPAHHLQQMGIRVDYIDGLDVCGQYFHEERRVEIRNGLHPDIERSVLAHEATHAEMNHEPQDWWCKDAKQERTTNAFAGRKLIDFHHFIELQSRGVGEKEMAAELGVARVILRAYTWLTEPAWQVASRAAGFFLPLLAAPGLIEAMSM